MRTQNLSRHDLRRLQPLIDFCIERSSYAHLVTLLLHDARRTVIGGDSQKLAPISEDVARIAPSLVRMWLVSPSSTYPKTSHHVKEVGPVVVHNFEEEFTLVLSHELHHVTQFYTNPYIDKHLAEVEAEQMAVKVLEELRTAIKRRLGRAQTAAPSGSARKQSNRRNPTRVRPRSKQAA